MSPPLSRSLSSRRYEPTVLGTLILLRTVSVLGLDSGLARLNLQLLHLMVRGSPGAAVMLTVYPNPSFAIPSKSMILNKPVLAGDSVEGTCVLLVLSFRAKSDRDRRLGSALGRPDSFSAGRRAAAGPRVSKRPIIGRSTGTQETI
jgi:hypothetical protein